MQENQEVIPFPAGDHMDARNRQYSMTDKHETQIPALLTEPFYNIQLIHSFEVDIRIYRPENSDVQWGEAEVNITFEGWLILMLT